MPGWRSAASWPGGSGLAELIDAELSVERRARPLKVRRGGLSAGELVVSLAECQLVGGSCFDDVEDVRADRAGARLRAVGATPSAPAALQNAKRFRRKLWPTENDRHAYRLVMEPGGPPADAEDDPSNNIQEAFTFFADAAKEFAIGDGIDSASIVSRYDRLRDWVLGQAALHVDETGWRTAGNDSGHERAEPWHDDRIGPPLTGGVGT